MRKVVRLTESDLVRIVKRVINEQTNPNQFCSVCKEWEDTDDSVYREGTWMVKGNKIIIKSKGVLGNETEIITKPNGFDSWSKGMTNGKFIGNPEHKKMSFNPSDIFSGDNDTYKICFTK